MTTGYIALEQARYNDAIAIFYESLKVNDHSHFVNIFLDVSYHSSLQIQKNLLEADNKLILSTLDNIGFAYCMLQELDKAVQVS
jgi:hypothetical protein